MRRPHTQNPPEAMHNVQDLGPGVHHPIIEIHLLGPMEYQIQEYHMEINILVNGL